MFYTYVLQSAKDNYLYVGFTKDLKNRLVMHNKGLVDATQNRIPLKLLYYEACHSKIKALEREKYLKSGYGKKYLEKRI